MKDGIPLQQSSIPAIANPFWSDIDIEQFYVASTISQFTLPIPSNSKMGHKFGHLLDVKELSLPNLMFDP